MNKIWEYLPNASNERASTTSLAVISGTMIASTENDDKAARVWKVDDHESQNDGSRENKLAEKDQKERRPIRVCSQPGLVGFQSKRG